MDGELLKQNEKIVKAIDEIVDAKEDQPAIMAVIGKSNVAGRKSNADKTKANTDKTKANTDKTKANAQNVKAMSAEF